MYRDGLQEVDRWAMPVTWFTAWAYAAAGRKTDAMRILDQIFQRPPRDYVSPAQIARVYNLLGDTDRAFQWLDKAFDDQDPDVTMAVYHPEFAGLRTHAKYADLRRKLKLPR